jgi:septum formation protein
MTRRLILASSSPRRKQLLRDAGYDFEVRAPADTAECGICSRETPPEMVARLAWQKAGDVARKITPSEGPCWVIGCDTVAECCGQILGKPHNREHAGEMLRMLSGREHRVYSGLCLWPKPGDNAHVVVDVTYLVMEKLTDVHIETYLDSMQWEGKAGAFGYQDGLDWVHITSGSESNVVGLPMELLRRMIDTLARDSEG